jgi:hypothetical protein
MEKPGPRAVASSLFIESPDLLPRLGGRCVLCASEDLHSAHLVVSGDSAS